MAALNLNSSPAMNELQRIVCLYTKCQPRPRIMQPRWSKPVLFPSFSLQFLFLFFSLSSALSSKTEKEIRKDIVGTSVTVTICLYTTGAHLFSPSTSLIEFFRVLLGFYRIFLRFSTVFSASSCFYLYAVSLYWRFLMDLCVIEVFFRWFYYILLFSRPFWSHFIAISKDISLLQG